MFPDAAMVVWEVHAVLANADEVKNLAHFPPTGRSFSIAGSPIGDAGLAELAKCPALKGITNLVLTQTKITDAGLQHLTAFPNLELLAVGNENYGGAGNNQINGSGFKYVAQLKKLRVFKADGCLLISGSMAALQFLKLTSLSLRTPGIGDHDMDALASMTTLTEAGCEPFVGYRGRIEKTRRANQLDLAWTKPG